MSGQGWGTFCCGRGASARRRPKRSTARQRFWTTSEFWTTRTLATAPRLLLLDEPTAGMNPSESEEMVQLFQRICEERGVCVLMIEHDMKVVMGVSQRILVLNFGRQIALGSPREVLENEEVITAYLGHQKVM